VHHPELNPIELVWNTAKGECARLFSNKTSFQDQRMHLEEAFSPDYSPTQKNRLEKVLCGPG
jgi:hypothetical protein